MTDQIHNQPISEEELNELEFKPFPYPWFALASGLYKYERKFNPWPPNPIPTKTPPIPIAPQPSQASIGEMQEDALDESLFDDDVNAGIWYLKEKVRLDIDGRFPQMTISGERWGSLTSSKVHWIASLTNTATNEYVGPIWYKHGNTSVIPHNFVKIKVVRSFWSNQRKVKVTFSGGGAGQFTRKYSFESTYQHRVEFEYDHTSNSTPVKAIQTHDHPNRPASLPSEKLTIKKVYQRSGFDVSISPNGGAVPLAGAGANGTWSDQEMHDAMQTYWSRFANKPNWALWTFFARLHDQGNGLGGIMFDDIGPNHRQGTAIFTDAFISNAPAGDSDPAAWVKRMRFWTAVHEMGHAFNLAHSWQKALVFQGKGPWISLPNDPTARSFMNYPYNVAGGEQAFFADFDFRFTDQELLFMRHAPSSFVQMGNAEWFDNHGFEEDASIQTSDLTLEISVTKSDGVFAFLEPPVLEIALRNSSNQPLSVSSHRIGERSDFVLIISRTGKPSRQWTPFTRHCGETPDKILASGDAVYDSVLMAVGRNGWDLAEPGRYTVQAAIRNGDAIIVSNKINIVVRPPSDRVEEIIAQDIYTPEVGQVMAIGGTRVVESVTSALENIVDKIPEHPMICQATAALAAPLTMDYKALEFSDVDNAENPKGAHVRGYKTDHKTAKKLMKAGLKGGTDAFVNAVGHSRYLRNAGRFVMTQSTREMSDESMRSTVEALFVEGASAVDRDVSDMT